jgi:hypothetical protein
MTVALFSLALVEASKWVMAGPSMPAPGRAVNGPVNPSGPIATVSIRPVAFGVDARHWSRWTPATRSLSTVKRHVHNVFDAFHDAPLKARRDPSTDRVTGIGTNAALYGAAVLSDVAGARLTFTDLSDRRASLGGSYATTFSVSYTSRIEVVARTASHETNHRALSPHHSVFFIVACHVVEAGGW